MHLRLLFQVTVLGILLVPLLVVAMTPVLSIDQASAALGPKGFDAGLDEARERATDSGGLKDVDAKTAVENIIKFVLGLIGVVAVLALVLGGGMYIISIGDESRADRAKRIILYAIIGLIIAGLSLSIVNFTIGLI